VFGLGFGEIVLLLIIGVLLFGKNLPEVGRTVGKWVRDLRQTLSGLENFDTHHDPRPELPPPPPMRPPQRIAASGPKFEDN
jgi:sec-independent protein translocase protein TatA